MPGLRVPRPGPRTALLLALLGFFVAAPDSAPAQVLVYRLVFADGAGYNVDFHDGGYLVAPALGGAPSLVLVNRPDGQPVYSAPAETGEFFIGLGQPASAGNTARRTLMATYSAVGSGNAALCAFGPVDAVVRLRGPGFDLRLRVAKTLGGSSVAASAEDGTPAPDGTLGFAHHAQVRLDLDAYLTDRANAAGGEGFDGIAAVIAHLERNGFRPEPEPEPEP
jgi:hypothetical protein